MSDILRIYCYGTCCVPDVWNGNQYGSMNRLYYIHNGKGGYMIDGVRHEFIPGRLYFFPYTTKYDLYSDSEDRINHTYANFELVPPVISRKVISCEVSESEMTRRALEVFIEGGKLCTQGKLQIKTRNSDLHKLCFSAITYLTSAVVASSPEVKTADDSLVICALETMHENMDKQILVSELANSLYISTDNFIRRFKRCIGVTPYAYLRGLRLGSARYMLDEGKSLAQTATAVGYSDASALLHALGKMKS